MTQVTSPTSLTIRRPDDWHVHLRDGDMLSAVVPYTARSFARAIVMPNLVPPLTARAQVVAYRDRIQAAVPKGVSFEPLMTAYLTDTITPAEIAAGFADKTWVAAKLYPAKATTNSDFGVTSVRGILPVLEKMAEIGMPLLVHGEVTDPSVDIFDRESLFIDTVLALLCDRLPELKIVFEHVTTADAVAFVKSRPQNVAATITAHHLHINRNAMFQGGIRPHFYCLPVAKREIHRLSLRDAATSGDPRFFLGTDSAPHLARDKESACGCAGLFTAPSALAAYLQVFEDESALDRFEGFASLHGPAFYGLPVNNDRITLRRSSPESAERVAAEIVARDQHIVPFWAGEALPWKIEAEAVIPA
jgi:dihydroorotase